MGRRKIEIQPITHERNRSVTFLKRKNGLFKKAYELGVLCSVDVAVIIFEERPGHHVKLFQYSSGDIHDIVQRHIRFDGEHDTRTPHDFASNTHSTKVDDPVDADDDDADDDDHDGRTPSGAGKLPYPSKHKQEYGNGKLGIPPAPVDRGLGADANDLGMQRTMAIPANPIHLPPSLPISTERQTSSSSRSLSANGSAKDQSLFNGYLPSSSYNPYLGSPLPSFEFPPSRSPLSRTGPATGPSGYHQRSATYPQQHPPSQDALQGLFNPMVRHGLPSGGTHPHGHPPSHAHTQAGINVQQPLFPTLLDGEEHRPQPASSNHSSFSALDWPTHSPAQGAIQGQPPQPEPGSQNETSWFEYLSQDNNAPPHSHSRPQFSHMSLHPGGTLSWERDRDAVDNYARHSAERGDGMIGLGGVGGTSGEKHTPTNGTPPMVSPGTRKRQRTESNPDDGRRPSPASLLGGVGMGGGAGSMRKKEDGR